MKFLLQLKTIYTNYANFAKKLIILTSFIVSMFAMTSHAVVIASDSTIGNQALPVYYMWLFQKNLNFPKDHGKTTSIHFVVDNPSADYVEVLKTIVGHNHKLTVDKDKLQAEAVYQLITGDKVKVTCANMVALGHAGPKASETAVACTMIMPNSAMASSSKSGTKQTNTDNADQEKGLSTNEAEQLARKHKSAFRSNASSFA